MLTFDFVEETPLSRLLGFSNEVENDQNKKTVLLKGKLWAPEKRFFSRNVEIKPEQILFRWSRPSFAPCIWWIIT